MGGIFGPGEDPDAGDSSDEDEDGFAQIVDVGGPTEVIDGVGGNRVDGNFLGGSVDGNFLGGSVDGNFVGGNNLGGGNLGGTFPRPPGYGIYYPSGFRPQQINPVGPPVRSPDGVYTDYIPQRYPSYPSYPTEPPSSDGNFQGFDGSVNIPSVGGDSDVAPIRDSGVGVGGPGGVGGSVGHQGVQGQGCTIHQILRSISTSTIQGPKTM